MPQKSAPLFPDPRTADEYGVVAVGGELSEARLLEAYQNGIFPWPHEGLPLLWFSPGERGILSFDRFHVPRSFQRELRKKTYRISFDQDFAGVIAGCAVQPREGQRGSSWITPAMQKVYLEMFQKGHAHSVECWRGSELVGGLYGIYVKGVFSGESMFHRESGASKWCLVALVEKLRTQGHGWFDTQMVTSVLELFGGEYIDRDDYLRLLKDTQAKQLRWV